MTNNKLKNLCLKNIKNYDPDILILLDTNYINELIYKINNVLKKNQDINFIMEKFLIILNLIIIELKNKFIKLNNDIFLVLEKIIPINEFEIIELLFSNIDIKDCNEYNYYYKKNVYKILINNFIRNISQFPQIKNLLKKSKIEYKQINDYSYEELTKIINLLSDIVFSSLNINNSILLFTYFDYEIYNNIDKNDLNNTLINKNKIIKLENKRFNDLLKEYHSKKKYLKYFR